MIDTQNLALQIKHNCNIADARYWGTYSLCGLLLRLRVLYRVEKGLQPWETIPLQEIGEWITGRETLWKELEEKDFQDICLNGQVFQPFEVEEINSRLEGAGLVYGAGFGIHLKPSFFLADILSKEEINGFTVYITGTEYARDLSDYPAMLQGKIILSRTEPMNLLIWGKFEEMKGKSCKKALAYAFSCYGITPGDEPSEELGRKIHTTALTEAKTLIYHEIGEAVEGEAIGDDWKNLLSSLPAGRPELFARSVKDLLSDASEHGMLKYIIRNRNRGSLGFYIIFLGGLRKVIFPEILDAFQQFIETGDWELIENARKAGFKKSWAYAERLLLLYRGNAGNDRIAEAIENEMLRGLL
jgi:hypothetical protein